MNVDNFNLALIKLEDAFTNYYNDYNIKHPVEVLFLGSQAILFTHKNISNQIINSSYEIDVAILFGDEHKEELSKISDIIDFSYGYGSQHDILPQLNFL